MLGNGTEPASICRHNAGNCSMRIDLSVEVNGRKPAFQLTKIGGSVEVQFNRQQQHQATEEDIVNFLACCGRPGPATSWALGLPQ